MNSANHLVTQAVILAAGRGTRIRDLTEDVPKPMVRVAGRPILERIVATKWREIATAREQIPAADYRDALRVSVFSAVPRETNAALVRLLLERKGDLKLNDDHAVRLLAHVVNLPSYELTGLLLQHGAAVNGSKDIDQPPLAVAAYRGDPNVVRLLLAHQADVGARWKGNGKTALHAAV